MPKRNQPAANELTRLNTFVGAGDSLSPLKSRRGRGGQTVTRSALWLCLGLFIGTFTVGMGGDAPQYWPQWRGPLGTGAAPNATPPVEWSETDNLRWKVPLPGRGHSSPVIWDEQIFLTTAVPVGQALKPKYSGAPGAHDNSPVTHRQEFLVLALNRRDGTTIWQQKVNEALPHEGAHNTGSLASGSPITDGKHVFAFFGSYGLHALNLDGEVIWKKDFGRMHSKHGHGEGSTPALHGDTLVVNWDHEGQSFVAALDKRTGREIWKVTRNEVTSWTSPIIVQQAGQMQAVVPGTNRVRGYDLSNGNVIWECGGLSANIVATPVSADGFLYTGSSYEKRAFLAIKLDGATGDITNTKQVVWARNRGTPYVPSPLLYDGHLYFLTHYQGILTRLHAKTGEDAPGAFRLGGIRDVYASPVGAAGRIYITSRDGKTLVISHDDKPKALAMNQLNDTFNASAALVDNEMFLRGERFLYNVAEGAK